VNRLCLTGTGKVALSGYYWVYSLRTGINLFYADVMEMELDCYENEMRELAGLSLRAKRTTMKADWRATLPQHHFPASLVLISSGECIKVMPIEDASLDELTKKFQLCIRNYVLPAGRVIMICSLSHLQATGL